jgi:MFS family permease
MSLRSLPDFRVWVASRSVSAAGTAATAVALPVLVYARSGSATLTAAVVGLEAVPYLLVGLLFGALADQRPRRPMMVWADLANAALVASVPVADAFGVLTSAQLLLVALGVGVGFCWFDSAAWGALPRLVGRARLARANSVVMSSNVVIGVVAPALTGLLIAAVPASLVLGIDALSYLASAALIHRISTPLNPENAPPAASIRGEIATGLRYIWRQPTVRLLTVTGFLASFAAGGAQGLLVVHADQALGIRAGDGRIGLLYAAGAVGALGAAWLMPRLASRQGYGACALVGFTVYVVAQVGLVFATSALAGLILWALWDFGYALAVANGITVRQLLTPDELQGRVNTTGRMLAWGGSPFGALLGGWVGQATDARTAFAVLVAPVAFGLLIILASPVRRLGPELAPP